MAPRNKKTKEERQAADAERKRLKRADKKFREQENAKKREKYAEKEKKPIMEEEVIAKRKKDAERKQEKRKDPEFRSQESKQIARSINAKRQDPVYRTQCNLKQSQRRAALLENDEYRRELRSYLSGERMMKEDNPSLYRAAENSLRRAKLRMRMENPEFASLHRAKVRQRQQKSRSVAENREKFNMKQKEAMRNKRIIPSFREDENIKKWKRVQKLLENPSYKKQKNRKQADRMEKMRQEIRFFREMDNDRRNMDNKVHRANPELKAKENRKQADKMEKMRQEIPGFREMDNDRRNMDNKVHRANPELRAKENRKQADKMEKMRQEIRFFREMDNDRRNIDNKVHRANPELRAKENRKQADKMEKMRQEIPGFREMDNDRRNIDNKVHRANPELRAKENRKQADKMEKMRQEIRGFREMDNDRRNMDNKVHRANPDLRAKENRKQADKMEKMRQEIRGYRQLQNDERVFDRRNKGTKPEVKKKNNMRRKEKLLDKRRTSEEFRLKDNERRIIDLNVEKVVNEYLVKQKNKKKADKIKARKVSGEGETLRRQDANRKFMALTDPERIATLPTNCYDGLLQKYESEMRKGPTSVCVCCGSLCYHTVSLEEREDSDNPDFWEKVTVAKAQEQVATFCGTCAGYVKKMKIPRVALSNGLKFPEIPDQLKELSKLEERLVALRIPFMQIRALNYEQQLGLKGNVVNVESNLNTCVSALPRTFDEASVVQIKFKRRMRDSHHYLYDRIRPKKVFEAAKFLLKTPLYTKSNVILSNEWIQRFQDDSEEVDFVVDSNDLEESDSDEETEGGVEEEVPEAVGATETLIYDGDSFGPREIHIAPGEGNVPVPLHMDLQAEFLSFPTIYCGQEYKLNPAAKLSYTDIAKSELRRFDRRCAKPEKILYSFKRSFNEKVRNAYQICLRQKRPNQAGGGNNLTAGFMSQPDNIKSLIAKDTGYAVYKGVRSTPAYWKDQTKRVVAMVRQLGNCTFFITLSAAERRWNELLVMLSLLVDNKVITEEEAQALPQDKKIELISSDPATCSLHFDNKYAALMRNLIKPEYGIFSPHRIVDHFSRVEYQLRGSPHSHGLYWADEAPQYNEDDPSSERKCVEFIDKFITCKKDMEGEMANLIIYQLHTHSHSCKKSSRHVRKCRFNYPLPPFPSTRILHPLPSNTDPKIKKSCTANFTKIENKLESIGRNASNAIPFEEFLVELELDEDQYVMAVRSNIKRATVFLKRETNEAYVNSYNKKMMLAWRANMDIQFVLDPYACAKYCVGYILKAEGGVSKLLRAAAEEEGKRRMSNEEKLKKFADILIRGSEISSQEAVAFILGLPNTSCSRSSVYINSSIPSDRIGLLKPNQELQNLPEDSEDIYIKGLLQHYAQRPESMENVCLAEFGSLYAYSKSKSPAPPTEETEDIPDETPAPQRRNAAQKIWLMDKSGYVQKRRQRKILRFRHYNKVTEPDMYWREQLMLFVPWRNEDEDLGENQNYQELAQTKMETIMSNSKPFYFSRELDENILNDLIDEVETEDLPITEDITNEMDIIEDERYVSSFLTDKPQKSTVIESLLPPKFIDDPDYERIMRSLNTKQRQIVYHIRRCLKLKKEAFYIFLSGGAGVGKSHVITAIVQAHMRYKQRFLESPESIPVIVTAPTGKAAFNVFGMTLHCAFKLPPNNFDGSFQELDDSSANTLRMKYLNTDLFIIDEISMVSSRQLDQIDSRLRQIFCVNQPFGGKSVLVVGHLRQLPPVGGSYVFLRPESRKDFLDREKLGRTRSRRLFDKNFLWDKFQYFELEEIMRQRGELEFCRALNNMSEGIMEDEDVQLMRSREIEQAGDPPEEAIWLFPTNALCQEHNNKVHLRLDGDGCQSTAYDNVQGHCSLAQKKNVMEAAKSFTAQESDGMPYSTYLKIGGIYFVTVNIDVSDGLFNGATGYLRHIEKGRTQSGEEAPVTAWMEFFHDLIGSELRKTYKYQRPKEVKDTWVPIQRVTRRLSRAERFPGKPVLMRTQIPLVAANGMTIMKSQGSSMPCVVVSTKKPLTRQNLYVACSRATSRNGLWISGMFSPPDPPNEFDAVTKEMEELRRRPVILNQRFLGISTTGMRRIYFQNIENFRKFREDILADPNIMNSDLIAFVEPHLTASSNLPGFSLVNFVPCHMENHHGNSEGNLLYIKDEFTQAYCENYIDKRNTDGHYIVTRVEFEDINVLIIYRHKDYPKGAFMSALERILQDEVQTERVIILGDINIDMLKDDSSSFKSLMENFGLSLKTGPTEVTTLYGTHIDVCFSNVPNLISTVYDTYYSYHSGLVVTY